MLLIRCPYCNETLPEAEFTAMLKDGVPFAHPTGTAYDYSNFGYAALGRIIANVAGQPYKDHVERELLAPLGMNDTGFKIIAGIRPLDWFGIEASYVNFGEVEEGPLAVESDGITGFGVFFLPAGPVDVFAKGGVISFDTDVKFQNLGSVRSDGTDFAYGVGLQFRLLSLGVRAEYEMFEIDHVEDANMISIGVTYTFL